MTAEDLRSALHESRERLFSSIRGLSEEQFRFLPDAEAWNIAAHLAHLLRTERIFAERARQASREDDVYCASTALSNDDDPSLAQHLAVPQMIHGMQAARRELQAVLDTGEAVLARAIVHETRGRMTVEDIVKKMSAHELEHADTISAVARQAASARRVTIPLTRRS